MEKNTKRLRLAEIQKDAYALNALLGIQGYTPSRAELSAEKVEDAYRALQNCQRIENQKEGELKAARDGSVKAEHAFHDLMLQVKDQIRAHFGASSDEYQSIGMKKKAEYKTPAKKK